MNEHYITVIGRPMCIFGNFKTRQTNADGWRHGGWEQSQCVHRLWRANAEGSGSDAQKWQWEATIDYNVARMYWYSLELL